MNSRDAAFDENLKEILESTAAEADGTAPHAETNSKPDNEDEDTESRVLYADPNLLLPSIPENTSAAHLILVLDMLSVRIASALTKISVKQVSS